jgi:hypothetical protein
MREGAMQVRPYDCRSFANARLGELGKAGDTQQAEANTDLVFKDLE